MRLVSFSGTDGTPRVGVVEDETVVDIAAAAPALPRTMRELAGVEDALEAVAAAVASAGDGSRLPLSDIRPLALVPDPSKVFCIGLNYADHAAEGGHEIPDYPALFMRGPSSLMAHGDPVVRPSCSDKLDYEAELLVVVGRARRHMSGDAALDAVFGYSCFNDVSVRDYQRKGQQWTPGKNFDATGPMGPWLVTPDALPAGASGLAIVSRLNGEVMQSSNTRHLIFSVARILEILTEFATLEPGDLIAMGTPGGVGYPRTPPVFMGPGDTIEVEIEGIGVLSNPIADERA